MHGSAPSFYEARKRMTTPEQVQAPCRCGKQLWKIRRGQYTLANRVLKLDDDGFLYAKCPDCAADVMVPWLQIKAAPSSHRLVIRPDILDNDRSS